MNPLSPSPPPAVSGINVALIYSVKKMRVSRVFRVIFMVSPFIVNNEHGVTQRRRVGVAMLQLCDDPAVSYDDEMFSAGRFK